MLGALGCWDVWGCCDDQNREKDEGEKIFEILGFYFFLKGKIVFFYIYYRKGKIVFSYLL